MQVLIAYATYSSGTQTVSELLEKYLKEKGWEICRKNIRDITPEMLSNYELVLFGSPSWLNNKKDGQPHEFFLQFMASMQGKSFSGSQFAVFGLGDTAYPNFCGAVHELEEFIKTLGGNLITESLRIDGYYFNEEENTKMLYAWADRVFMSQTNLH